jgi:hypothetical protein
MNGKENAWKNMREVNGCTGNQRTNHQSNPPIRPEVGLSNCMGNQEPPGLPQESHVTVPPPLEKRVIRIRIDT